MYTRLRQNQGYNGRGQPMNQNQGQGYINTGYPQQGNFGQNQNSGSNQQGNFNKPNQQQQQFKPTALQQQQQQLQLQSRQMHNAQTPKQMVQQQQQQQQTPLPQQQQQQQQQQQPMTPTTPRLKPILKQSPAINNTPTPTTPVAQGTPPPQNNAALQNTPISAPNDNNMAMTEHEFKNEVNTPMDVESGELQPKWRRARIPGFKINKKLKRLRLNQRLRRALQPKNAIMVLNEMKTGVQFTFPEAQAAMSNSLFVVHAEIDGKTYVGQGLSKPLARQNAAENALKCLLLEKMTTAAAKARVDAESDGQSIAMDGPQNPGKDNSNDQTGGAPQENAPEEHDEVPWSSLASFALYKLFLEWQNQGTVVPVPRPGLSPGRAKKEPKAPIPKEVPSNALNIHPVMLLNQLKPGLTYNEVNRSGNPPNTMFTLGIEIDGVQYTGSAKNKKDAKKMAAKSALAMLYNLTYPDEPKMDHTEDISLA